jgi:hypothetical protein
VFIVYIHASIAEEAATVRDFFKKKNNQLLYKIVDFMHEILNSHILIHQKLLSNAHYIIRYSLSLLL